MKLAAVVYFTPLFILPGVLFAALSYALGVIYIAAQLSVKRFAISHILTQMLLLIVIYSEMSNARSPVFSHFGAAINGITSICAYGAKERFKAELVQRIDKYTRPARVFYNLNRCVGASLSGIRMTELFLRWIGIRVNALGGLFAAGLAV